MSVNWKKYGNGLFCTANGVTFTITTIAYDTEATARLYFAGSEGWQHLESHHVNRSYRKTGLFRREWTQTAEETKAAAIQQAKNYAEFLMSLPFTISSGSPAPVPAPANQ